MRISRTSPAARAAAAYSILASAFILVTEAARTEATQTEARVTHHARGDFEPRVIPRQDKAGDGRIGAWSLEKQFGGALTATSKGEMLGVRTASGTSGGYVAIEIVEGELDGRRGTFMLQHLGSMQGGRSQMTVTVVPDSGTGELVGISGSMRIIIEQGRHSYDFEYVIGQT